MYARRSAGLFGEPHDHQGQDTYPDLLHCMDTCPSCRRLLVCVLSGRRWANRTVHVVAIILDRHGFIDLVRHDPVQGFV